MKGERPLDYHPTDFGFAWGPVEVQRTTQFADGRGVISIWSESQELTVYFSRTGRSLRVFRGGKELKEVEG